MSAFGRAFLRLAACAALRDMTLVGGQVYDSRIAAYDTDTWLPIIGDITGSIGVYAEQDSGPELSENGGPPFRSEIELVLEIAMQARVALQTGEYEIGAPETDDQLEMTLDAIEGQAELALFRRQEKPCVAFRRLTKRTGEKSSVRFTDPKSAAKLAIRYVSYKIEIEDPEIPIFDATRTGLNRLPDTWRAVALAWPEDSPEREKATRLCDLLAAPPPARFVTFAPDITPPAATMTPGNTPNPPREETWTITQ